MSNFMASMPWYLNTAIIMALVIAATIFFFYFGNKAVRRIQTDDERETISISLHFLSLFYAVFVVLVFIDVQTQHDQIQDNVVKEASILMDLHHITDAQPLFAKTDITKAIRNYADDVIHRESALMRAGDDAALVPFIHPTSIWNAVSSANPESYKDLAIYENVLCRLNELTDARFQRFTSVDGRTTPFIWTVLIYGGVLVVASLLMLSAQSSTSNLLLVSFTVSMLVLVLMLIFSLDKPFCGSTAVPLKAFEEVLQHIKMGN